MSSLRAPRGTILTSWYPRHANIKHIPMLSYVDICRLWFRNTDWNAPPNSLKSRGPLIDPPIRLRVSGPETLEVPWQSSSQHSMYVGSRVGRRWLQSADSESFHNIRAAPFAAAVPPELFGEIPFYMYLDYQEHKQGRGYCTWSNKLEGPLYEYHGGIFACSLVCRYWANQCRRYMFSGMELHIRTCEQAEMLVRYALHGSPSLVPIHTLISSIGVFQDHAAPRSFLHRLFLLKSIAGKYLKFDFLILGDTVPDGFSSCKLDTPHWSVPSSIATPPSVISYLQITLVRIHFPTFSHLSKYIRYLNPVTEICYDSLTWGIDGFVTGVPVRMRRKIRQAKLRYFVINVCDCTDNTRLFFQALTVCTQSLLATLLPFEHDAEHGAIIRWIQYFCAKGTVDFIRARLDCEYSNYRISEWYLG